jgi:tetratricopeptide (TPR) repeat protein
MTPLVGARLVIDKVVDWPRTGDPHEALKQLRVLDKGDDTTWVVGYIAPGDTAAKAMSELGQGEPLGHHVIVRAWAEKQETDALAATLPDLKEAERTELIVAHRRHKQTVVLVHFLAATLGAIAETDPQWIQNPLYSPKQMGFSERNRELLQLAIDERITDGTDLAIAKKLLDSIEKSEWGGWIAADKETVVNRLRNVVDAARAGKTATDIPPAAYDQVTRIKQLATQGQLADALAELDNVVAAYPGNGALTQLKCELLLAGTPPPAPPPKGKKAPPPPAPKLVGGVKDPKTRAACARVSELAPADPGPHLALADALLRINERAEARSELAKAETKIAALPAGAGAAWKKVIDMYMAMGSLTWTEEAIAKAKLENDPIAATVAQTRNRYGVPRGAKFVTPDKEGDLVAAVKSAQVAIYAKKFGEAAKLLAAAAKSWPGAPGIDAERCELEYYQAHIDAARAACARALATYPDESWALYLSAIVTFQNPNATKQGIEYLKKAIAVDPDLGQAWRTLAKAYARAKDTAAREQLAKDYQAKFGTPLPP